MRELAQSAYANRSYRVYLVGGGTAVLEGWRESSIDADLYAPQERILRDVQAIKERLAINIEFERPEGFVPPLEGSDSRHVFVQAVGRVSFYHYDPYAQLLSKVVRGFARDLADAQAFVASGMKVRSTQRFPKIRSIVAWYPGDRGASSSSRTTA
jgi:hypothetical protein